MPRPPAAFAAPLLSAVLCAVLSAAAAPAEDAPIDVHEMFERRCLSCHGHAGAFARERLTLVETAAGVEARGRRGRDLRPFLARHGGGLTPEETDRLLAVFARQLASGALYERRCGICHGTARELARLELILRDGALTGRYTGRDIAGFLRGHGRLSPDEAETMTEALTEILKGGR